MFCVTKVVTASEQEWRNGVKKPTPPHSFSLISTPLPRKPKLDLLFGSRSRRGQRKSQCISISCPISSPMSVELNLGWPSSIPTEGCLAETGKELALENSRLQRSARKLSLPSDPCQYYNGKNKIKNTPFLIKKDKNFVYSRQQTLPPWPVSKLATEIRLQQNKSEPPWDSNRRRPKSTYPAASPGLTDVTISRLWGQPYGNVYIYFLQDNMV